MPAQPNSSGRDIIFNLRLVNDPGNAETARKFGGGVIPPGGSSTAPGGRGGPRGAGATEEARAKAKAAAEREEERIHKRHRERQLERGKRNRDAREEEVREHAKALAAQDREEERIHRRQRQRQLERARANRQEREERRFDGLSDETGFGGSLNRGVAMRHQVRMGQAGKRSGGGMMASSGFMEMAMGATHLGLVGEKDSQALLNGVLAASGAVHAVRGAGTMGAGLSTAAGGMGIAAGGGIAAVSAAAVAAIASLAVSIKMLHEISSGTAGEVDSFTSRMGRLKEWMHRGMLSIANPNGVSAAGEQPYTAAANNAAKTARMEKELDARDAMRARQEAFGGIRAGGGNTLFDARMGAISGSATADAAARNPKLKGASLGLAAVSSERIGLYNEQMFQEQQQQAAKTDQEREAAADRILKIQERLVELAGTAADLARQEATDKLTAARESLALTKTELDTRKDSIKALTGKVVSAAERFGNLSEADQTRTLDAGRLVKKAKELRLRGRGAQADELLRSIPKEDRQRLTSLGLTGADAGSRRAALMEAKEKGFMDIFGGEEKRKIVAEEAIARKLEVEIKRQEEVVVKIEDNLEEVTRQVVNAVRSENDRRYAHLREQVQRQMDAGFTEVSRRLEREARAAPGR